MAHLLLPTSLISSDVCSSPTCPCRPLYTAVPGFIQLESVLPSVSVMFLVWWMLLPLSIYLELKDTITQHLLHQLTGGGSLHTDITAF